MKSKTPPAAAPHCNACGSGGPWTVGQLERIVVEGIEVHVCPDAAACLRRAKGAGVGAYERGGA